MVPSLTHWSVDRLSEESRSIIADLCASLPQPLNVHDQLMFLATNQCGDFLMDWISQALTFFEHEEENYWSINLIAARIAHTMLTRPSQFRPSGPILPIDHWSKVFSLRQFLWRLALLRRPGLATHTPNAYSDRATNPLACLNLQVSISKLLDLPANVPFVLEVEHLGPAGETSTQAPSGSLVSLPINFPNSSSSYFMDSSSNFAQFHFGREELSSCSEAEWSSFSDEIYISEKRTGAISECVVDREARRITFRHIDGVEFQLRVSYTPVAVAAVAPTT